VRGRGRLLDVGCNEGRGLERYRANGFEPEGLELNRVAAAAARARGFVVHGCDIIDLMPERRYRVVVLSNVLEHSLNPREMMRAVHRILEQEGEVWISLPNARSALAARWGRDWINWHVPFHITHFTPQRLSRFMSETGFEPWGGSIVTPALWVAQSAIAHRHPNQPTRLRSLPAVVLRMAIARLLLFPILWFWNLQAEGDCITMRARRRS
jgi:SAM-dependent methyltransferase